MVKQPAFIQQWQVVRIIAAQRTRIVILVTLEDQDDSYQLKMEPAHYFCFPGIGTAIAVRPGDMLVFNPQYYHCCSRKTSHYSKVDVYANAFYLKTGVVGLNDNNIELTDEQEKLAVEKNLKKCKR